MIIGAVDAALEARIPLVIEDSSGKPHSLDAVVDTGFSAFLTLPPALIASLGLPWLCDQETMFGDGSIQVLDVFVAIVIWDSQPRTIRTLAVGTQPLVGMKLLEKCEVRIGVVDGGRVVIDALP